MKIGEQVELMRQALLGRKVTAITGTADSIALMTEESTVVLGFLESREFTMHKPHQYRALITSEAGAVTLESPDRKLLEEVMDCYNARHPHG